MDFCFCQGDEAPVICYIRLIRGGATKRPALNADMPLLTHFYHPRVTVMLSPCLTREIFVKKTLGLMILSLSSVLSFAAATTAPASNGFSPAQVQDIQKIVHQYLIQHPDVLVEASQALQAQMQAKQVQAALSAVKQNAAQIFSDSASPVAGNPNGSVTLVEFFDYQCGHCKEMNTIVQGIVKKDSNLRVVFKELPIFGGNSQFAAKVALAAYIVDPSKYYALHDALLNVENPMSDSKAFKAVRDAGYSEDQIKTIKKDMDGPVVQKQLKDNFQLAQALQLAGTPAFIIANKDQSQLRFIPGSTSAADLQKQIMDVSAAASSTPSTSG